MASEEWVRVRHAPVVGWPLREEEGYATRVH